MILASILCALVVVMTVVPYTGYISIGGVLEITTLHIVTILAGVLLGWKYGALVGGVWGLTCILRCLIALPIYKPFGFANVFVALLPRVCVGAVAGLLFGWLKRTRVAPTPLHHDLGHRRDADQHRAGALRHDHLLQGPWR